MPRDARVKSLRLIIIAVAIVVAVVIGVIVYSTSEDATSDIENDDVSTPMNNDDDDASASSTPNMGEQDVPHALQYLQGTWETNTFLDGLILRMSFDNYTFKFLEQGGGRGTDTIAGTITRISGQTNGEILNIELSVQMTTTANLTLGDNSEGNSHVGETRDTQTFTVTLSADKQWLLFRYDGNDYVLQKR